MTKPTKATRTRRQRLDLVPFQIEDFPLPLKRALVAQAKREGIGMNDIAVAILASHYRVAFTQSGRAPYAPATDKGTVTFQVPKLLRKKIRVEAARLEVPRREVALRILDEAFERRKAEKAA